jgi:hypothetical protein
MVSHGAARSSVDGCGSAGGAVARLKPVAIPTSPKEGKHNWLSKAAPIQSMD